MLKIISDKALSSHGDTATEHFMSQIAFTIDFYILNVELILSDQPY